jgi:hypothetical protein
MTIDEVKIKFRPIKLKKKWVDFSINHHFSDWGNKITSEEIFDGLVEESWDCVETAYEIFGIVVWGPYSDLKINELAERVIVMAEDLQYLEEKR